MRPVDALILAAGRASRMGVPKVLLPAGEGHALLSRVLHTALESVDGHVIVVLGRDAALCKTEIERFLQEYPQYQTRVSTTENLHYERGLSTSLRCGVQEVLKREPASGLMILLADQPAFDVTRARNLVQTFRERSKNTVAVAAAEHGEQRNPVIFSPDLLSELLEVKGDKGARGVLKRYEGRVERLELGSGPWFVDTDNWTTYAKLVRECGWLEATIIPKFTGEATAELTEGIEAAWQREPQPLLASDVLLAELDEPRELLRLEPPPVGVLTEQGIETVVVGGDASPAARLDLLRRAALWTLQRQAKEKLAKLP